MIITDFDRSLRLECLKLGESWAQTRFRDGYYGADPIDLAQRFYDFVCALDGQKAEGK